MSLTKEELDKYSRHFLIEGFSEKHQLKLKNAKILVIGAGGLGSPALLYLAGAGIGTLGIVENDVIVNSNLPRQVIYSQKNIGKSKAAQALEKILDLNPGSQVIIFEQKWEKSNAKQISTDFHMIMDCTDNLKSRYLSDETSLELNIPFIYGAVYQMEGQLAVFNFKGSKSFTEFFRNKNIQHETGPQGILGPVAGVIGSLMAAEAIKIITGIGEVLTNRMLFISLRYNRYQLFNF